MAKPMQLSFLTGTKMQYDYEEVSQFVTVMQKYKVSLPEEHVGREYMRVATNLRLKAFRKIKAMDQMMGDHYKKEGVFMNPFSMTKEYSKVYGEFLVAVSRINFIYNSLFGPIMIQYPLEQEDVE